MAYRKERAPSQRRQRRQRRVARADVKPDTVIVVECDQLLSLAAKEQIRTTLKGVWPNQRILVCDRGLRLRLLDIA